MDRLILVVEDEKAILDIITYNLKREGYNVIFASDGQTGLDMALNAAPDLILLDVMLPFIDGFEICARVRKVSDVPIIMITAREGENDIILGLETGADDYMTKPFSMKELIARVRANMRRLARDEKEAAADVQSAGAERGIVFDENRREIRKDGKPIDLTMREYELLSFLMGEPEKPFSREELMAKVWGYDYYGDLRAVDVAVRRLREKVEEDAGNPSFIITKRGFGYYFKNG